MSNAQMVSVVKDGAANASNYMPVRAVLEQQGYVVDWDGSTNTVIFCDKPAEYADEGKALVDEMYSNLGVAPASNAYEVLVATINIKADAYGGLIMRQYVLWL